MQFFRLAWEGFRVASWQADGRSLAGAKGEPIAAAQFPVGRAGLHRMNLRLENQPHTRIAGARAVAAFSGPVLASANL
jgi:hypothetical protein